MSGDERETKLKKTRKLDAKNLSPMAPRNTGALDVAPWAIELRIMGTPDVIRVPQKTMVVLGRVDERNATQPDIDLGKYNGQYQGVSRHHVRFTIRDNKVAVEDLESVNGTYINGHILKSDQTYRLRDADRLRLGLMELQVNFVIKPTVKDDTLVGIETSMSVPKLAKGERLLIVDDNEDVCQIISHIAERAGFTVKTCHNAVEAITYLGSNKIDALALELMLPDANGLDIVSYLRNLYGTRIPILTVTSATAGYRMTQAIDQGVDLFLNKPVSVEEIITALGKIMNIMSN